MRKIQFIVKKSPSFCQAITYMHTFAVINENKKPKYNASLLLHPVQQTHIV